MNRRHFLSACAGAAAADFALAPPAVAQAIVPARTPVDADLDIAVLRTAMRIHPGLYRYQSPRRAEQQLALFEREYRAASDREAMAAAYLALSRYLTTLRCGHSYANFFNQRDPMVSALFAGRTRLPFWFRWHGNRMIVTRDTQGIGIAPGSEIERINGQRASALLASLLPLTRADGANDGKRRALLSVQGTETCETFDIFQGLIAPPDDGRHRLTVRTADGRQMAMTVAAIDLAQRRAEMVRVAEDSDLPRWTWSERGDGVRVLTMPGWSMWNSRWDWRAWLEDRLDSLADARGLVIDIRDNEGGDDCGDPILARLIDRPMRGWPFSARIRFAEMPALLRTHATTWDDRFYSLGDDAQPLGNGEWTPREDAVQAAIAPSVKRIDCPVATLISPTNSSATFAFVNAAKATGKVRLFGETTGGNRRGVNGGAFLFVKLPFSGIVFDLPLKGYWPLQPQPDRGIEPDAFVVRPANADASADAAIEQAAAWCRR